MADYFREAFEGLKDTAAALVEASEANQQANEALQQANAANHQANEALQRAGAGITKMADAALHAREEHEDLPDTVARLEALVIDLVRKSTPPPA